MRLPTLMIIHRSGHSVLFFNWQPDLRPIRKVKASLPRPVPFRKDLKELLTCHSENQESQRCFHRDCHRLLPSSATDTRKLADGDYFWRVFSPLPSLWSEERRGTEDFKRRRKKIISVSLRGIPQMTTGHWGVEAWREEHWLLSVSPEMRRRLDAFCQSAPTAPLVLELCAQQKPATENRVAPLDFFSAQYKQRFPGKIWVRS